MALLDEMVAELDAIAAARGIVWSRGEIAGLDNSEKEPSRGNGTTHAASEPITPKQRGLLGWLPQRKGQPALTEAQLDGMSKRSASAMLDRLSGMKDAPAFDLKTQSL